MRKEILTSSPQFDFCVAIIIRFDIFPVAYLTSLLVGGLSFRSLFSPFLFFYFFILIVVSLIYFYVQEDKAVAEQDSSKKKKEESIF